MLRASPAVRGRILLRSGSKAGRITQEWCGPAFCLLSADYGLNGIKDSDFGVGALVT